MPHVDPNLDQRYPLYTAGHVLAALQLDPAHAEALAADPLGRLLLAVALNAAAKAEPDLYVWKATFIRFAMKEADAWYVAAHDHGDYGKQVLFVEVGPVQAAFHFGELSDERFAKLLNVEQLVPAGIRRWSRIQLQPLIGSLIRAFVEGGPEFVASVIEGAPAAARA